MLIDTIRRWLQRPDEPHRRTVNTTIHALEQGDQEIERRLKQITVAMARYELQRRDQSDAP